MESFRKPPSLKIKDQENIEWKKWKKSFETYLIASKLDAESDQRKIAILINLLGEDAQEIFDNFTFTEGEKPEKYDIVLQKFEEHCLPQKNLVVERYEFFNITQKDGEPFDSFLTRLRTSASTCEFNDQCDWLIRDRIIHCLKDKSMIEKLLRADPNITLLKTIGMCRSAEVSKRQVQTIHDGHQQLNAVHSHPTRPVLRRIKHLRETPRG